MATFLSNAVVLRRVDGELLGVVNVTLALLYSTTLFLGREAFRKACLRVPRARVHPRAWQRVTNLVWLAPLAGAAVAAALAAVWLSLRQQVRGAWLGFPGAPDVGR